MKKPDMRPEGLKRTIDFALNMLFAFLTLGVIFGIVWFMYLIIEIGKYQ